ncbi:FYVE zinc finger [Pyrenophora tritici-repentis]|uniref:RING-type E3 ubiquitin transferase n=1 Tax=Pyrenophora tritici-repentis TaxID=45151 RepID=A0A922NH15_9PLEO|nr:FYVE zinc finger [Pyrenophora tritici-repentis]KAI1671256.1 FYVE zinc finger [Pyrenophora tritici-repentis]KAI1685069.1 FYVE zinc finger [Pyrenophora tritici-repentis]
MTPNANPRPSGPYMHNSHAYGSQHDVSISNTERAREARIGSNSRHHSQGVVASHFLAQDRETWMDFLREGTDISTNQPPTSSISTPTTASEDRANPSSSRYTLPTRPPPHADSSPPSSSDRKRRLTTADSPMRRPSSIRMHSENTGATIANPILLDSPPAVRALPPTPSIPTQANIAAPRRQSDIVLPPWQPDSEVTQCPVCKKPFTFLLRRHHCRKCGRVVCASCSPHRITIPRQFIVHPPSESITNYIDLTSDDENAMSNFGPFRNPALGGGEEVRVCNPCVPDPNFSPPPQYDTPARASRYPGQFPPTARSPYISRPQPPPHPRAHRSASSVQGTSQFAGQAQIHGGRDPSNDQSRRVSYHGNSNIGERRLPPLPPSAAQQQYPHHRAPLISQTIASNRPRNTQSRSNYGYGSFTGSSTFGQSPYTPVPPPLQPQRAQPPRPRRQVAEEDECPICGEELPPKGPNNDDTERTQHIQECIALHSASPGPTAALAQVTSASLPNQRTRGMSSAGNGEGASNQSRMSHAARGMFPYVATEKDCIDDEGRQAECTICLEDFEAGDKMARLVCWCKFHESCIKEWWDKKGRGACPTHQLQE